MTMATAEPYAIPTSSAPDGNSPGALFVSTSLATWTTSNPEQFARDCQINDTAYRQLDPEYYAWLRSRMVIAKKTSTAGHLDAAAFEVLRARFNAVHVWAVESFGEEELLAAVRRFRSGDYQPPRPEDDGARWISWDEWLRRQPLCTKQEREAYHRQREAERQEKLRQERLRLEKVKDERLKSRKRRA